MAFFLISVEDGEWFANINLDLKQKITEISIESNDLQAKLDVPIGRGNFGVIYLGQLRRGDKLTTVAIKTLKGSSLLINFHVLHDSQCIHCTIPVIQAGILLVIY